MPRTIRPCRAEEIGTILEIVNAAAIVYRGVIPDDCWHEPYMTDAQLRRDIAAGVSFRACELDGALAGVMGLQPVQDVELIRHAYVRPDSQRHGIGGALMRDLQQQVTRPVLVGTWADAHWAISFYQRHGFELVPPERTQAVLARYWNIPARQAEVSVVLSRPAGARANS